MVAAGSSDGQWSTADDPCPQSSDTAAPAGSSEAAGAAIDGEARPVETAAPKMLEALVCPASGGRLDYDRAAGELVSRSAGLAYPIRSGIPIMLIDEARRLDG